MVFGRRVAAVATFFSDNFFRVEREKPELYGPFWVFYSLALAIPVVSNICSYLQSPTTFKYDYSLLPITAGLSLSIGLLLPVLLFLITKLGGCSLSLLQCYCLYGYTYYLLLVGVFLCLIPNRIGAVVATAIVFLSGKVFLVVNLRGEFGGEVAVARKYGALGLVTLMQVALAVAFHLFLFDRIIHPQP